MLSSTVKESFSIISGLVNDINDTLSLDISLDKGLLDHNSKSSLFMMNSLHANDIDKSAEVIKSNIHKFEDIISKKKADLTVSNLTPSTTQFNVSDSLIAAAPAMGINSLASPYTDASYLEDINFGDQSHWLQPWRAYTETVSAKTFLNGVGVGLDLNDGENPDLVVQMLANHGIKNVRIEINWSKLSYSDETLQNDRLQTILEACKKWSVRPLILLNGNQGAPTPIQFFDRTVTANALAGSTKIRLKDTSGLVVGKSGLNNLTDYWAAESLITAINGNVLTLSKPLPNAIKKGTSVSMSTLKYRPFSAPGSTDYNQTIAGWQHYVGTVADFATNALGTSQSVDKGFDMEIWNELTFGSEFLSINNYYRRNVANYEEESIWSNLVKATADYAVAHPSQFSGVQFSNGFANTIPWIASSEQPARINAISKHPYANRKNFPVDEAHGQGLDALGQDTDFVPTYSAFFPEYFGTALQTETFLRDAGPITNDVYGVEHGRYAREVNGKVLPTDVWITETGISPEEDGITDPTQALAIKAKTSAREFTFNLNKGVTKVDLFSATSGDLGRGIVQDNFLDYTKTHSIYPTNDRPYVSPALAITGHIVDQMKLYLDPNLIQIQQIQLDSISDTHNHFQFSGNGTVATPNLYDRDVFTFLPYQVNNDRFVIPYYVMTRDVTKDLTPEKFTIQISQLEAQGATVSVYDPMNDRTLPVTINSRGSDFLNLSLNATDYPYLLIVQE